MLNKVHNQKPRTQAAYEEIKRRILDNEFPPGFRALEQDLADLLGISRTPVREALGRLQIERLVEVIPRRGMRVLPISPEEMGWIQQILERLETAAAGLLAARTPSARVLASLEHAVVKMESALEGKDLDAWAAADERFHRLLLTECGNPRLAETTFTLWDQSHRARMVCLRLRSTLQASNRDHRALLESIRVGDSESAERIHKEHLARTGSETMGILLQYNLTSL